MPAVRPGASLTSAVTDETVNSAAGLQPFQCSVCTKRFTRHENLKRHRAVHAAGDGGSSLQCPYCSTTFSRADLRKRHVRRKHPEHAARPTSMAARPLTNVSPPPPTMDNTVSFDYETRGLESEQELSLLSPCHSGSSTMDSAVPFADGGANQSWGFESLGHIPEGQTPTEDYSSQIRPTTSFTISPVETTASLEPHDIAVGLDLFFDNVAPFLPFIHRPTFDDFDAQSPLLLAVVCLGLQYSTHTAPASALSSKCFHQALGILETNSHPSKTLETIQAYLLLETYSIMYCCGSVTTDQGLQLHAKAVTARLFEPLKMKPKSTTNLDALWHQYIRVESHKRTCYGLYQIDSMLYHLLSLPRALSHLEIRHDMPCAHDLWAQTTAAGWAHVSLTNEAAAPKYIMAVHNCLSASASPCNFTSLDAYALSLVHAFILSSVRECSGWSTMTGQVCFERFRVLQSAGRVLEPVVTSKAPDNPLARLCEAILHASMVELLMWAPSHTSGFVETSLENALASAIHLARTLPISVDPDVMESLEPHIAWFLCYLDGPVDYAQEPPWFTCYAFRVILCVWQLALGDSFQPTPDLGLSTIADLESWTRTVFSRRTRWEVGRLIMKSLEQLETTAQAGELPHR